MITKRESKKIENICNSILHEFPCYTFGTGWARNGTLISATGWAHFQVVKTIKTKSQVNQINKENVLKILVNKKWTNNNQKEKTLKYLKMIMSKDINSKQLGVELLFRQSFFDIYPQLGNLINELPTDLREHIRQWPK